MRIDESRALTIQSPGMLTTVQDAGRFGWMASGFSPSGAMDLAAMRRANLLVGNSMDMAVLEMTMTGVTATFGCDCVIALTGADMAASCYGQLPRYRAVAVRAGDTLICGSAKAGVRSYLAVAGGFALEPAMGSCSTSLKFGLGGYEGRKLRAGDTLPLRCPELPVPRLEERVLPAPLWPGDATQVCLRAVLGPQDAHFTQEGIATFLGGWYTVTPASDRMGIKLEGNRIEAVHGYDIISDGIAPGSVQVPASGQPIVMMADCQTTGGYAKIATVISVDLPLLAQARPGDRVCFAAVTIQAAQKAARAEAAALHRLEKL
ncbi:MAG: biotin-dependent carboxyltransferase family protein [Oscillospiraceae bacterium]|jgi:biotin-dependent carboxylase-like uncharacterized protein|nr:biotin-dependent carboxyltransferase family protein [Oscillospiraceae bacterium]